MNFKMKIRRLLFAIITVVFVSMLYASARNLDENCEYLLDRKGCAISYRQALTMLLDKTIEIDDLKVLRLINLDKMPKNVEAKYKTTLLNFEIEIRFESLLSKCGFQYKEPTNEDERGMKEFQMMHDIVHGLYLVKRNIIEYFYAQKMVEQKRLAQQELERRSYYDSEPIAVTSANRAKNIGKSTGKHKKGSKTHRPSKIF